MLPETHRRVPHAAPCLLVLPLTESSAPGTPNYTQTWVPMLLPHRSLQPNCTSWQQDPMGSRTPSLHAIIRILTKLPFKGQLGSEGAPGPTPLIEFLLKGLLIMGVKAAPGPPGDTPWGIPGTNWPVCFMGCEGATSEGPADTRVLFHPMQTVSGSPKGGRNQGDTQGEEGLKLWCACQNENDHIWGSSKTT